MSTNSSLVKLLASFVGAEASCKHQKHTHEELWGKEYCNGIYARLQHREDETKVIWPAICTFHTHNLFMAVSTVLKSKKGLYKQLKCKLCHATSQVSKAEVQLATSVSATLPGIQLVSQAVLLPNKPVDMWWPECKTVVEVDGNSHSGMHKKDRQLAAKFGRTKAEYDAHVTLALQALGFTVFRFKDYEVSCSAKVDALLQHLSTNTK
jgi:very-short-patch-repair endonuclease